MAIYKNKAIIVTAPSGAGKTTLVRYLLNTFPHLAFSISATTRAIRNNEVDGLDYHFISIADFKNKIKHKDFLEWEEVYPNNYYGTLLQQTLEVLEVQPIIFDVDVMGAARIKRYFKEEALAIFVCPPSFEIMKERLRNRKTESDEKIAMRLKRVELEMTFQDSFDYKLINDDLQKSLLQAENIVRNFLG